MFADIGLPSLSFGKVFTPALDSQVSRHPAIPGCSNLLGRARFYWKARFFLGASCLAMSQALDIIVIKLLIELLQMPGTVAGHIADKTMLLGAVLVLLYVSSTILKAAVGADKARCAEAIAQQSHENASASTFSWRRADLIEQHALIGTVMSGIAICVFAVLLYWPIGAVFAMFLLVSIWGAIRAAKSYRRYYNRALRDHQDPGSSHYARVLKRIVSANRTEMVIRLSGAAIFGLILWCTLERSLPIGTAIVLAFAAKMLIRSASSIASPLIRMERAKSHVELGAAKLKPRR
jgi:hypothetical protein